MNECIYTHTYVNGMYASTHTYVYGHTHTYVNGMYTCTHTHVSTHTHVYGHISAHTSPRMTHAQVLTYEDIMSTHTRTHRLSRTSA